MVGDASPAIIFLFSDFDLQTGPGEQLDMVFLSRIADLIDALAQRHRMLPWLIAYALLLPLPFILSTFFNDYLIDLANRACLFIMLAVGLNIVKGFCGQVTVGHIGLYAIGAVTSAVLSLEPGGFGGALDLVCRYGCQSRSQCWSPLLPASLSDCPRFDWKVHISRLRRLGSVSPSASSLL